jgi:DNA-binding transcriptional LysR family regulator
MLKPLHLLTLKAVVHSGSFAVAARDLGYTASAVSQQISALEKESGLVLFEREAHGIRPTAAAHRLVDLSARVLAALDDLDHEVRELAGGATGRLRLGSFPTADVRLVPSALSAFVEAHPRARR